MAKKEIRQDCPIQHIAFIMDGNGRWAKKRLMPRESGHKFGADAFRKILRHCGNIGMKAATFYVFSTENWKRPQKEVDSLMALLNDYLDECEVELTKNDARFIFIGDRSPFSPEMQAKMEKIERASLGKPYTANIALNYGGRDELVHAANSLIAEGKTHLTEDDITTHLYTKDSPPLDVIVRTGGDYRISNFLLWQAAYAELYFTDTLWPDFKPSDVDEIVENFKKRDRRFGGVKE
jgi:undecaprenyl diphosphate synthase